MKLVFDEFVVDVIDVYGQEEGLRYVQELPLRKASACAQSFVLK